MELIDRCGSAGEAGAYALVSPNTLYRVINNVNCTVQQATARKILIALEHKRDEDRKAHVIHERHLKARKKAARDQQRIYESIERMAGY